MAQPKTIRQFIQAYRRIAKSPEMKDELYWWHELDSVLVEMCTALPKHKNLNEVYRKVALINRAYRAKLEMGPDGPELKVAKAFVKKDIDKQRFGATPSAWGILRKNF